MRLRNPEGRMLERLDERKSEMRRGKVTERLGKSIYAVQLPNGNTVRASVSGQDAFIVDQPVTIDRTRGDSQWTIVTRNPEGQYEKAPEEQTVRKRPIRQIDDQPVPAQPPISSGPLYIFDTTGTKIITGGTAGGWKRKPTPFWNMLSFCPKTSDLVYASAWANFADVYWSLDTASLTFTEIDMSAYEAPGLSYYPAYARMSYHAATDRLWMIWTNNNLTPDMYLRGFVAGGASGFDFNVTLPDSYVIGTAISNDKVYIMGGTGHADTAYAYSATTGALVATIPLPSGYYGTCMTAYSDSVWIGTKKVGFETTDGSAVRIDATTDTVTHNLLQAPSIAGPIVADGTYVHAISYQQTSLAQWRDDGGWYYRDALTFPYGPNSVTTGGGSVWVTEYGDGTETYPAKVYRVDAANLAIQDSTNPLGILQGLDAIFYKS